ncbi:MAG: urease accessory protein UreD [Rhodospirillales bacterium]|nr:urease accessory protein UreD [Rhodospirillales bacterium]MBO6787024.1 urease accessory protein UreD [Rhodospirillales bacterium]
MFDDTSPFDHATAPVLQRTKGAAACSFKRRDDRTVLDRLHQSGSFKVRLPRLDPGQSPEAVLLNTAGGLTGGDTLSFEGEIATGCEAVFTTQASERAYRALSGDAVVTNHLKSAAGSTLAWLPQETILFDGARLKRSFDVDLEGDAALLAHESVVFGRAAMGEKMTRGAFSDIWRIRRDGRLIHADALRVDGPVADILGDAATLNGAHAMATILYTAADAAERLDAVRDIIDGLSPAIGISGASAWSEKLVIRAVATSGANLRRIVEPLISGLRGGKPMPRVWST